MKKLTFTLTAMLAVALFAVVLAAKASAADVWWDWRHLGAGPNGWVIGSDRTRRTYYRRNSRYHKHKHTRVKKHHAEKVDDGRVCLNTIRIVGSQWATEQGAWNSAKKAWMEQTRNRHGELFMDIKTAKDIMRRCTRSSIGELAGQTLNRCQIKARPCKPPFEAATD